MSWDYYDNEPQWRVGLPTSMLDEEDEDDNPPKENQTMKNYCRPEFDEHDENCIKGINRCTSDDYPEDGEELPTCQEFDEED